MGAIDAIRSMIGLRVPEDVMLAGFDDIPAAAWLAYDLTTFVQDAPLMVEKALEIVSSTAVARASPGEIRMVVPARLIERGTTPSLGT